MADELIDEALKDLNVKKDESLRLDKRVTTCIPLEYKNKYELIQKKTGNDFSKEHRKFLMKLIDSAYSKIS